MCEANVYIMRSGQEELFMEKVDRIVPGEEDTLFLESIFGERRVVKARIREMELVHHRIVIEEMPTVPSLREAELWLEPDTDHGHFHEGEEVALNLYKGYNMQPEHDADIDGLQAFMIEAGTALPLEIHQHHGKPQLHPGREADGLVQVYVYQPGDKALYAKTIVEIGHHHHHQVEPVGLPLEMVPCGYSHARIGDYYNLQVLKEGVPVPGLEVKATYSSTRSQDYPHHLTTDAEGKVKLFLTARGHYLFSTSSDQVISTFTLVKSF